MLALGLSSCTTARDEAIVKQPLPDDLICIASIGSGQDRDVHPIEEWLGKEGINVYFSGSVIYAVVTARSDAAKAQQILKAHDELERIHISYYALEKAPVYVAGSGGGGR
jgi:hypothetical protein